MRAQALLLIFIYFYLLSEWSDLILLFCVSLVPMGCSSDGLNWKQEWWGQMPFQDGEAPSSDTGVITESSPQNYGANNFCASSHRDSSSSCLAEGSSNFTVEPSATMLTHMRPYDADRANFGMVSASEPTLSIADTY